MYGEEGIVALTPETGPTDEEAVEGELDVDLGGLYGFYPPPDKIEEYADVNTEANIRMAWFAGALYRAQVTQYKATQHCAKNTYTIITLALQNAVLPVDFFK